MEKILKELIGHKVSVMCVNSPLACRIGTVEAVQDGYVQVYHHEQLDEYRAPIEYTAYVALQHIVSVIPHDS